MRKILVNIAFLIGLVTSQLTTSCGIIDFDMGEITQSSYEMSLNLDTAVVLQGESFHLTPIFTPDSIDNQEVYWMSSNSNVVFVLGNNLIALNEGEAIVKAISVQNRNMDSCYVKVLPRWEVNPYQYSDDMVVYANVQIGGKAFDSKNMLLGAFIGGQLRGIGEEIEWTGTKYYKIRIYGYLDLDRDEVGNPEIVKFAYYHPDKLQLNYFKQYLLFDGETHGTLSALFEINDN